MMLLATYEFVPDHHRRHVARMMIEYKNSSAAKMKRQHKNRIACHPISAKSLMFYQRLTTSQAETLEDNRYRQIRNRMKVIVF